MGRKLSCILLVDDDEVTNFLHKKILKEADVAEHILVALNGEEALDILRNVSDYKESGYPQPELIFLDINMPRMNGWEFIEEYQKLDESIKGNLLVVMLTVSLNPAEEIKASKLPAITAFRSKPLTVEMVNKLIASLK